MTVNLYFWFFFSLISPHVVSAALPQIDFDRMGKVGLAGAFAGISLFNPNAPTFDPATSTLLVRDPTGSLSRIGSTNPGGIIIAGCALRDLYYLGGSFTSVNGVQANNIISYSPSSGTFTPLGTGGPNGQINAVFCDAKTSNVWVGGHFTSPGASVAIWNVGASSWSGPPFGGLSGASAQVNSITTNPASSSLFFAGSFVSAFAGDGSPAIVNSNNPNLPPSSGATAFTSSLVPIPLQSAEVSGSPSSLDPQFSNILVTLCPSGPDGPGNSWLAQAPTTAVITARTFAFMSASGIRLGNTFQSGFGTTVFSVTSIPDNTVRSMHYVDPTTGQTTTCTDCPLLLNPAIPYQDFLFENVVDITGVQVKLSGFQPSGPGLHLFQLLSSGAFASALDRNNPKSCFASNPSNTTRTGDWIEKLANTNIAGTTQEVLVATFPVTTAPNDAPSFEWIPYISASGQYDINLLTPGCTNFQDCGERTSVKVTVFPGDGLQPWVTTVSQQNKDDSVELIYRGPVLPSTSNSVTTITMKLADQPAGSGEGGKYTIVADRVQLVLTASSSGSSATPSVGANGANAGAMNGFGFFEWPLNPAQATFDATKTVPKSSVTSLDTIGIDLYKQLGQLVVSPDVLIHAVVHHPSGAVFVGGQFKLSSGMAHIVVFKNGNLVALAGNGLNGPVSSLLLYGDKLYVGGSFTDTSGATSQGKLSGVAMYDVQRDQWNSLQGGVSGKVTSLGLSDKKLQVAGNFVDAISSTGDVLPASGLAVWDIPSASWINSGGFMVGSLSFVGNGTAPAKSAGQSQILAGSISASLPWGANGFVTLQNGRDGPNVVPLAAGLDRNVVPKDAPPARREDIPGGSTGWEPLVDLFSRQASANPIPPLPDSLPSPAPAVLAGTFWTNSTSSEEVVIIGGSFSFPSESGRAQAVAIYDMKTAKLAPLLGAQLNGVVRTLLVLRDMLYVGGQFTMDGTDAVNGIAIYDLVRQQWNLDLKPLGNKSGSSSSSTPVVVVRSITTSLLKPNAIIVAGSFTQAGDLPCQAICSLDSGTVQWTTLGNGILGEVTTVAYAGSKQEALVASGSMTLLDNTVATNVLKYTFSNSTWSAIGSGGDLPGPVTALEVNSGNENSIFAAGKTSDGASTFLSFWNGRSWNKQASTLQGSSSVSQLIMVPVQNRHSSNGVIEPDRVLMISGSLADSGFGVASSALFDGQNLMPFITALSATGAPASIASLFHSFTTFSFNRRRFLATGIVILISIAIAAGVVFFLALIGILWTLFAKRDNKVNATETDEDDDDSTRMRPSSLLEHINAATRTTILSGPQTSHEEKDAGRVPVPHGAESLERDSGNTTTRGGTSEVVTARGGLSDGGENGRPSLGRYSFERPEDPSITLNSRPASRGGR